MRQTRWARARLRRPWLIVLVAVMLLGTAAAFAGWRAWTAERDHAAARSASSAAASSLVRLLSYTPASVATDLAEESQLLTGDFRDEYVSLVTAKIAPKARARKITTSAKVVGTSVASGNGEQVKLLMFVDVTASGPSLAEPRITGSRLLVTVDHVGSRWLISGLKPL